MVFSDPLFLVGFLPASMIIFHLLRVYAGGPQAQWALVILSMIFYGYWSISFLCLLLTQIAINYYFALQLASTRDRVLLRWAVVLNLGLLAYFKYRNFFLDNIGQLIGANFNLVALIVPLGISFHTFQQISILVDIKNKQTEPPPFLNYVLFVLFFPQLIAGPIVLHREIGRQVVALRSGQGPGLSWLVPGALIFVFGLFKKVCLADNIAHFADLAFMPNQELMALEAWAGAVAYMLQLFFDFSGYSEMAVGLGMMFGFLLPNNFLVPYSATSMIEFWKRWHITMTRFFMMYVNTPLWLRLRRRLRNSKSHQLHPKPAVEFGVTVALPVLITFFLAGLWHGAGWTFICFGLVNGAGLVINQAWNAAGLPSLPKVLGWALTMLVTVVGLVYFRSQDLSQAHYILHQMFLAPDALSIPTWASSLLPLNLPVRTYSFLGAMRSAIYCFYWIALLGILAVLLPPLAAEPKALNPSLRKAFAMSSMMWLIAGLIGEPRTFLYFAF